MAATALPYRTRNCLARTMRLRGSGILLLSRSTRNLPAAPKGRGLPQPSLRERAAANIDMVECRITAWAHRSLCRQIGLRTEYDSTMPEPNDVTLILHGWGGNKPEHWQEHLYRSLSEAGADVRYPKLPDPTAPKLIRWMITIQDALDEIHDKSRLTVVAHSLGAISWMHTAFNNIEGRIADRVLLVAPPYVIPTIPPVDAPPGVGGFFPPPLDASCIAEAARETVIVGGDNDDYATYDQMSAYAHHLKIAIHKLEGAGHISPYWGYGEWPWVRDWCLRRAELPPRPK